jgi:hypothetical protein
MLLQFCQTFEVLENHMKLTTKTLALALTATVLASTTAMADTACRTRTLDGDWTMTLHGAYPDVNQDPVWIDHLYLACDVSAGRDGSFAGTCQDMLAASVGEPATAPVTGQLTVNRRSCVVSGTANLGGTDANVEARVLDAGVTLPSLIDGVAIISLEAQPVPGIDIIILNMRMIREPWGGSEFNIDEG